MFYFKTSPRHVSVWKIYPMTTRPKSLNSYPEHFKFGSTEQQLKINLNIWFICTLWLLLVHRGIKKEIQPTDQPKTPQTHHPTAKNDRYSVDAHLSFYFPASRWLLTLMSAMGVKPSKERPTFLLSHGILQKLDCPSSLQTKHYYISFWDITQDTFLQDIWHTSLSFLMNLTLSDLFRAHQELSFFKSAMAVLDENIQMISM